MNNSYDTSKILSFSTHKLERLEELLKVGVACVFACMHVPWAGGSLLWFGLDKTK